jgi:hypothetical protein
VGGWGDTQQTRQEHDAKRLARGEGLPNPLVFQAWAMIQCCGDVTRDCPGS